MERSINQLMELTGFSFRTVKKRLEGLQPVRNDGRAIFYQSQEALPLLYKIMSDNEMAERLAEVELAVEEERLVKLKLENGKATGELASIEDVAKTVEKEYSFVRAQLRSIPSKLAKPLSMLTDPNEVFTRIKDSVDECLAELTADTTYEQSRAQLESAREAVEAKPIVSSEAVTDFEPSRVGGSEEIS